MKISTTRWKQAQRFEYKEWVSVPQTVENEWEEIVRKYKPYLEKLSDRLNIDNSWKILENFLDANRDLIIRYQLETIFNEDGIILLKKETEEKKV